MKTLAIRSYQGERDLEAIAELFQACEIVDRLDNWVSISALRRAFNTPVPDIKHEISLWEDGDGKLVGFGQLSIQESSVDAHLSFKVHPTFRGEGIEQEIIKWSEQRIIDKSVSVKLRSDSRETQTERMALLESCGFTPNRYFLRMERSLTEPFPKPELPRGFTLESPLSQSFSGKICQRHFLEAWVEMFNQTFIDHWNHHDLTVEQLEHEISHPHYRQDLDLVAISASDSTFAAFCSCFINSEKNQHKGMKEGKIGILGTRRGFRKCGLGKAMLLSGMQRLRDVGMDKALLGVDAENPSGANRLYESVGFHKVHTTIVYVKEF
ncbi:MAG: GNAT family N-acetyltransferase [Okeania sp. SIO2F4]|uniref:GNAT family N-acetyltransferase n=1 Tax=Okeania sp. SIO2F4 TaxID=2607790 RepID=UPI00142BD0B5|nr:GNAT family N-acetyltransferase [Okeania sp. SIO2F4]NES07540.1 GNAT family N-acetyltransferase [Okeania sp. SIO2F4]